LGHEARAVTWFPFGPDGGDARAFAADPKDPRHVYLGTATGWIYQSVDGGTHWTRLASVGKRDDLVIDNMLIDPANPKRIVAGAWKLADLHHPDGGIYISNDGGVTWTAQPEMRGQSILSLAAAPSDPKTMVAGSMDGVFRSTDSGEHWELISPKGSTEIHEVESLAVDPVNPQVIYAGTWHLPWKTTDGGVHWTNMKQGIIEDSDVFSIIVDPKTPSTVYLSACSGIYKSEDGGAKFTGGVGVNKTQGIPSTARRTRVLMQDPNKPTTVFAGTTEGLYRTDDAGKFWVQTTGPDVIVNDVYVDPENPKHVLLATDRGGVLASNDGGTSFAQSNAGFSTRQVVAYVADANRPATVYVGVVNDKSWGGVFVSRNGGLAWSQLSAGLDGRDVFSLAQAPDGTILAGTSHGIYYLDGPVWQRAAAEVNLAPVPASGNHMTGSGKVAVRTRPAAAVKGRVASHGTPFDGAVFGLVRVGETMFAATSQGLLESPSSGRSWSSATRAARDEYHFVSAEKQVVAAASLGALDVSVDGGGSWKSVPLPAGMTQVTAMSVDGHGGLWVGDRDGVYYAAGAGAEWRPMKELYLRNPDSIYYDAGKDRVLITSSGPGTTAFAVQLPTLAMSTWDTGWNLRFMRPIGDHLIAGTLFDGIVVQPRMVASQDPSTPTTAQR
jgi:photosystem II stability/assembly factor-like uncharacterized protein